MQEEEDIRSMVGAYAWLCVHQWERYAVQQRDGSYWAVYEPLTEELLAAHLTGRITLGTYLLGASNTCRFAVFDADGEQGLAQLLRLREKLQDDDGIATILEASRRGGHLWLFLTEPLPARLVRCWLLPYAQSYGMELYPKQDSLVSGGTGSLIRLPLGMHQRSRGWYPFLTEVPSGERSCLVPVGQTRAQCLSWLLTSVCRVEVPALVRARFLQESEDAVTQRGETLFRVRAGADGGVLLDSSLHGVIRSWCEAQDIEAVIGRYVALDRRGMGHCPFKDHHQRGDVRPSFQVFGGNNPHWYCYTWGRAGDLFDFLCFLQHLSPEEGWERLQQGTLVP